MAKAATGRDDFFSIFVAPGFGRRSLEPRTLDRTAVAWWGGGGSCCFRALGFKSWSAAAVVAVRPNLRVSADSGFVLFLFMLSRPEESEEASHSRSLLLLLMSYDSSGQSYPRCVGPGMHPALARWDAKKTPKPQNPKLEAPEPKKLVRYSEPFSLQVPLRPLSTIQSQQICSLCLQRRTQTSQHVAFDSSFWILDLVSGSGLWEFQSLC